MGSTFAIRRASLDTFEAASSLLERFFQEEGFQTPVDELRASLRAMMAAPASAVFLAWRQEQATGVATVTSSVGLEYGRAAEIEDLYVLPGERGGGVASALIEAACAWCQEQGVSTVLVTVTPEGEAEHGLLDFYEGRGFASKGRVILERAL